MSEGIRTVYPKFDLGRGASRQFDRPPRQIYATIDRGWRQTARIRNGFTITDRPFHSVSHWLDLNRP